MEDKKAKTVKEQNETAEEQKTAMAEKAEKANGKKAEVKTEDEEKTNKAEAVEDVSEKLKAALEAKEKELAELNDKYLRMAAEYDNFRRRSAKEREGVYADAMSDTIQAILPIFDNLERAAQFSGGDPANVAKGLEMTLKSFGDVMNKLGVKEIEALGKTFDPNLHNAVMHIEDDEHGEGEITDVLQKGFIKGDKVIRYAMVKVAN